jgi:hypothetical protein
MATQDIIQRISETASDETKQQIRQLWVHFNHSIAIGRPIMFLPKYYGDQIGEQALEAMARRFS